MSSVCRFDEVLLSLAIHRIRGLEFLERLALKAIAVSTDRFSGFTSDTASTILGREPRQRWRGEDLVREAETTFAAAESIGSQLILYSDPAYPETLRTLQDPPFLLFCRGILPCLSRPMIAVVGTRKPRVALIEAERIGKEASLCDIPVVSGLARGIDAAAHHGALRAGGPTIAVLGSGIDWIYPSGNKVLAAEILNRGGAILSEYAPGREPSKKQFPERNQILAGLSRGVVVVEAPRGSGALITVDFALEQGRDVFVHEAGLGKGWSLGTEELVLNGATRINSITDILSAWGAAESLGSSRLFAGSLHGSDYLNDRSVSGCGGSDTIRNTAPGVRVAERVRRELEMISSLSNGVQSE